MIEECIYYPEFLGSYSIKKVALVLLGQEERYDHLAVGDGMVAVNNFQELVKFKLDDLRRSNIRNNLQEYCKQDTLLMVKLQSWLHSNH